MPEFPDLLFDLWGWFLLLHQDRCGGMGGPITHVMIDAFCRRRKIDMSAWEMDAIRALDDVAISVSGG